jgi:hypothetical protein
MNSRATQVVALSTEQALPEPSETPKTPAEHKNPAAVALGKLGGLKGGKARAQKLSAWRKKSIAKKAAKARWSV